jgi:signal transduction histidine kinase
VALLQQVSQRAGFHALLACLCCERVASSAVSPISRGLRESFRQVVELLQTFAAVDTGIENARLFREIERKSHELEIASLLSRSSWPTRSHELRTPLNAILGYTELIVDQIYGPVPEKIADVLERWKRAGAIFRLINDVLDLSNRGRSTGTISERLLSMKWHKCCHCGWLLASEKKLQLLVDVTPGLPVGNGDERRITQVLLNLVGNAISLRIWRSRRTVTKRDGMFQ